MALNWQAPAGGYSDDAVYAFLKLIETDSGYLAPPPVYGHPIIGIGFNLREKSVQTKS